jgi:hypothetical protein
MLAVLRDETADPSRRDDMARSAAPYLHPRLSSVGVGGKEEPIKVELSHAAALAAIEDAFESIEGQHAQR